MQNSQKTLTTVQHSHGHGVGNGALDVADLLERARGDSDTVLTQLRSRVGGDIIRLAAGDMVPADARVLSAKDLFLNQAALTGEALPVEKRAVPPAANMQNPLEFSNLCFLGSNVESGSATALVIHRPRRAPARRSNGFMLCM